MNQLYEGLNFSAFVEERPELTKDETERWHAKKVEERIHINSIIGVKPIYSGKVSR